jgi:hypothetical protein
VLLPRIDHVTDVALGSRSHPERRRPPVAHGWWTDETVARAKFVRRIGEYGTIPGARITLVDAVEAHLLAGAACGSNLSKDAMRRMGDHFMPASERSTETKTETRDSKTARSQRRRRIR